MLIEVDSWVLCNAMGHPGCQEKITHYNTCIFELFLLIKQALLLEKMTTSGKIMKHMHCNMCWYPIAQTF